MTNTKERDLRRDQYFVSAGRHSGAFNHCGGLGRHRHRDGVPTAGRARWRHQRWPIGADRDAGTVADD